MVEAAGVGNILRLCSGRNLLKLRVHRMYRIHQLDDLRPKFDPQNFLFLQLTDYKRVKMVEAAGVEPASETTQQEESTRVSSSFGFRSPALRTGKIADPLVR